MDDIIKYILVGFTILFFISIWIALIKYVFIPLTQPRLSTNLKHKPVFYCTDDIFPSIKECKDKLMDQVF